MNAKYTLIDEAKAVVKKHFGDNVTIEPMIDEIVNHKDENISSKGFKDLFVGDQLKKTVFCAVSWGANILPTCAILSFVPMILKAMGIHDENTFYTLILNGMFLLAAIIVLLIVDKLSRRKMLLGGMIVSGAPLVILGFWTGAPIWLITACFTIHLIGNQCYGTVAAYISCGIISDGIKGNRRRVLFSSEQNFLSIRHIYFPCSYGKIRRISSSYWNSGYCRYCLCNGSCMGT